MSVLKICLLSMLALIVVSPAFADGAQIIGSAIGASAGSYVGSLANPSPFQHREVKPNGTSVTYYSDDMFGPRPSARTVARPAYRPNYVAPGDAPPPSYYYGNRN